MNSHGSSADDSQATRALVLSIVGAACAALLTNALDTSPAVRVFGTFLGAAVPQLIAQAGPWHSLRAGAAIGVTAVALFVAYGGFTLFAFASDNPSVVPLPSFVPDPTGGKSSGPGVDVSTKSVDCGTVEAGDERPCDRVIVKSTGTRPLKVFSVVFTPLHVFAHNQNCVTKGLLRNGEQCWVDVSFAPDPSSEPGTRSAVMTIHENISDDTGVHVTVQGEVAPRSPVGDLQIMSDSLHCDFAVGTLIDGEPKDAVKIMFVVDLVDPTGRTPPAQVSVRAVDDLSEQEGGLPERDTDFPVGQEGSLVIPINEAVYTRPSTGLTFEVDPGQSVVETDNSNNTLHMKFALPEQSGGSPTQSEWVPLQHCDPIE